MGEREGARSGDAWWEEKFDQICARYNPKGLLTFSAQEADAWGEEEKAFHEWLHESGVWDRFYRDVVTCKKNQDHCSHCREELREERERLGEDERCACCGRVFADDSDEESIYNPVEGYICSECDDNNNER